MEVEPNANPPEDAEEHAPGDLPPEVMIYTLPSRYCQSDMLRGWPTTSSDSSIPVDVAC